MFSHVANRFGCENFGLIGGGDVPRGIEGGKKKKKKRRASQSVSCFGVLLKFARVVQTRYLF